MTQSLTDRLLSAARYASESGLTVGEASGRLEEFHRIATPQAILAALSNPTNPSDRGAA